MVLELQLSKIKITNENSTKNLNWSREQLLSKIERVMEDLNRTLCATRWNESTRHFYSKNELHNHAEMR